METGTVNWYNDAKGFGFITPDNGGEQVLIFKADRQDGYRVLYEGDRVEYVKISSPKGPKATEVKMA